MKAYAQSIKDGQVFMIEYHDPNYEELALKRVEAYRNHYDTCKKCLPNVLARIPTTTA